ncbi:MAG: sporulation protein [Limnochordaceae bacterium]|nr:sporulation protein [Limnochordaceae bacterium]
MVDMDLNAVIDNLMANTERMVSTRRVIGEPFQVGNVTLIPIMTATVGVGAGGGSGKGPESEGKTTGEGGGAGGGLGMRLVPTALAAIVDGELRVYSLGGRGALEKLLDLVPDLVQKVGAGKKAAGEQKQGSTGA